MIEAQFFKTPEGHEMVILPAEEYARLAALDTVPIDDVADAIAAKKALESVEREGVIPAEVLNIILDENVSAVRAWRKYRGLSTPKLAEAAGVSQAYVSKVERGEIYGTRKTRQKIADALKAPLWALDDED